MSGTHITGLHTVGIPVTNQDRAIDFYVGKLGFEVRMDAAYGEGERWVELAPRGAATTVALVRAETDTSAGIDTQIRLTSGDVAADHATMKAAGVDLDTDIIPYPVPMFVFRDQDGNRLIVVEQPQG